MGSHGAVVKILRMAKKDLWKWVNQEWRLKKATMALLPGMALS